MKGTTNRDVLLGMGVFAGAYIVLIVIFLSVARLSGMDSVIMLMTASIAGLVVDTFQLRRQVRRLAEQIQADQKK